MSICLGKLFCVRKKWCWCCDCILVVRRALSRWSASAKYVSELHTGSWFLLWEGKCFYPLGSTTCWTTWSFLLGLGAVLATRIRQQQNRNQKQIKSTIKVKSQPAPKANPTTKKKSTAKTETKLTALVVAPGKGLKPVFIQKLEDRQPEWKLLDQI